MIWISSTVATMHSRLGKQLMRKHLSLKKGRLATIMIFAELCGWF